MTARAQIDGLTPRGRAAIAKRLAAASGAMTTATVSAMEQRHGWYSELDAEHRSWITVVARAGIDGFVRWFRGDEDALSTTQIFDAAPRSLTRQITLAQTVELVRTTIEVVEDQFGELMPRGDRAVLRTAMLHYSREVAFAAAEVYARAAETRGAWDARIEALVVDAVVRAETDETVLSRASTLGWRSYHHVCVVVGRAPTPDETPPEELRRAAAAHGLDLLASIQGDRLVCVLGGPQLTDDVAVVATVRELADHFAAGPVVIGPLVDHLADAAGSARAALAGMRASAAWPEAPRPVTSAELLPERVLSGDGHARRTLAQDVYRPLAQAGGELLETLVSFLDAGGSIEATARNRFVHPNTVRYRLRRIQEVTGYAASDPREAYVLRLAITLGRLLNTNN